MLVGDEEIISLLDRTDSPSESEKGKRSPAFQKMWCLPHSRRRRHSARQTKADGAQDTMVNDYPKYLRARRPRCLLLLRVHAPRTAGLH